jgi:hypothetical protein
VLGYYLDGPGYSATRLVFFIVPGGLAVLGAVGVICQRDWVAILGAVGLLAVGFWQAVLWIYVFGVVAFLLAASFIRTNDHSLDRYTRLETGGLSSHRLVQQWSRSWSQ